MDYVKLSHTRVLELTVRIDIDAPPHIRMYIKSNFHYPARYSTLTAFED